jgi:tetratricopeptide (TPR) repeat protein
VLERAADRAPVRQEALLRMGAFESDIGQHGAAIERFDRIGPLADPFLRYWLGLLKGRALQRAGRHEDAVAVYRAAVAEFPSAQSAAFNLAAALVALRRPSEASAVIERVLRDADASTPDPWLTYRTPDVRLWPAALDEIRMAVRR